MPSDIRQTDHRSNWKVWAVSCLKMKYYLVSVKDLMILRISCGEAQGSEKTSDPHGEQEGGRQTDKDKTTPNRPQQNE